MAGEAQRTPTATQKRIERAFQRAMNIRDSSPGWVADVIENRYARLYRRAYRNNDANGFSVETRWYLKQLREAADPCHRERGREIDRGETDTVYE